MSEQEINKIIAANIARYMEMRNITQREIAEYMGVSQASVSNWCKGVKMPRMDKFDRLCELFRCNRSDLMDPEGVKEEDTVQQLLERAFSDRPEMRMLFSIAEKSSKEDIERAIKIIEALKTE